jgi:vanillate/3-O-methylgallate O-demethylase
MIYQTLEQKLQAAGSAVKLAHNSQIGPYILLQVPPEFSNWRDERIAWRETAALLDLTHHMTDLSIEGPDAIRLLSDLGVNSFTNFRVNEAKQLVCCSPDGYVIGDGILVLPRAEQDQPPRAPLAHNWVQYHAQSGRYDVTVERDEPTAGTATGTRKLYRFQVRGPSAIEVLKRATGGARPEIKFFNIGELKIAGRAVRALRHGMSSAPGLEPFGPWEDKEDVRAATETAQGDARMKRRRRRRCYADSAPQRWERSQVHQPSLFRLRCLELRQSAQERRQSWIVHGLRLQLQRARAALVGHGRC